MTHIPVLINEVLEHLDPKPGDDFIDCTVGEGGHALAILKMTAPDGRLLGIDRDADMADRFRQRAEQLGVSERLVVHHGNFKDIREIAKKYKFFKVKGILFDVGVSSWHIDKSGKGFSFQNIEPLDMRFDRTGGGTTALEIVNSWPEKVIARIIYEFGEERHSRRIAKAIVEERKINKIVTTDQLVGVISRAISKKSHGVHFATRTFQALRIAVNNELENIEIGIKEAINILSSGGRVAVISFHSLEDRIVKNVFKNEVLLKVITKKPIRPLGEEVGRNPRARSAKLRVAELI